MYRPSSPSFSLTDLFLELFMRFRSFSTSLPVDQYTAVFTMPRTDSIADHLPLFGSAVRISVTANPVIAEVIGFWSGAAKQNDSQFQYYYV